jgi:uncharacterized protein YcbK (DUF882 family)
MSIWNWLRKEKLPKEEPRIKETFEQYFNRQGFSYFTGEELAKYFHRWRGDVKNAYPPKAMWPNFLPTLRIVDDLRRITGKPVRITSSYRSPDYNRAVGGAPLSQHKRFNAADIQCDGVTPHEVFKVLEAWRVLGKFKGGLGQYSTFVHIDTRGNNATW